MKKNTPKTSLQKSHSKVSNLKLTLICLLSSSSLTGIIGFSALMPHHYHPIVLVGLIASSILFVLTVFAINAFKR